MVAKVTNKLKMAMEMMTVVKMVMKVRETADELETIVRMVVEGTLIERMVLRKTAKMGRI